MTGADKKINHTERAHALLSASGASRWMACTPSARLEDPLPSKTSIHAEEGTLAHEFAELELRKSQNIITTEAYGATLAELRDHVLYTDDMEEHVEKYTSYVLEQLSSSKDGSLIIEEKVNFSAYVPEGYGTCDAIILPGSIKKLFVTDLKYGKGVQVDADDNSQLKLYALGAYLRYNMTHEIDVIRLTIVQPRLDHISAWEISVPDLLKWAEEVLKPKALEAYNGEGELCAGSHCRFCRVASSCRALAEYSMQSAKLDFADDNEPDRLLSDDEMVELYLKIPTIEIWIKAVHEFMHDEAVKGRIWKGLKLVEGRSNRVWLDHSKVVDALRDNLYPDKMTHNIKLAGIGAIEKLLGKVKFKEILGQHVTKPTGKASLVPSSDKRPAFGVESAKRDFYEPMDDQLD